MRYHPEVEQTEPEIQAKKVEPVVVDLDSEDMLDKQAQLGATREQEDILVNWDVNRFYDSKRTADTQAERQDAVHEPDVSHREAAEQAQQQTEARSKDDEELAKTAGQLLESVADNTSDKFRESNFLSLMRQLRDYEVRVEGDKVVRVSPPPEALSHSPNRTPTPLPAQTTSPRRLHRHLHPSSKSDPITCKVFGCAEDAVDGFNDAE